MSRNIIVVCVLFGIASLIVWLVGDLKHEDMYKNLAVFMLVIATGLAFLHEHLPQRKKVLRPHPWYGANLRAAEMLSDN